MLILLKVLKSNMKNFQLIVSGKVQGVFFRKNTKKEADKLGLKGWVKNEIDSSVKIEVEGEQEVLEKFIGWCKKGPDMASVKDVGISEGEIKNFTSFEILY